MRLQTIWNKIKTWISDNRIILAYIVCAVAIEQICVFIIENTFALSRPFLSIGILLFAVGIALMVKGELARLIVCSVFLVFQAFMDLVFILIYDMTGQYFYYEMLSLRNDAVAIMESIPVNFLAFYAAFFFCTVFIVYGLRKRKKEKVAKEGKYTLFYQIAVCLLGICTVGASVVSYYPRSIEDRYEEMINGTEQSVYASYGMVGNFIGEFGSKIWEKKEAPIEERMEQFLYAEDKTSKPTDYFGSSKNKNVVMILAESFEWFSFINSEEVKEEYPNALPFTEEELATLFPNLTKFYQNSIIANNFHSREKTDISETLTIMGSYPLDAYVTYDYHENVMPMTLPNILKVTQGEMQKRSFHNGDKEFYNREITHTSFGFDEVMWDKHDMEKYAKEQAQDGEKPTFTNYDNEKSSSAEYNLDSEMIETCKDIMFPADERFFTYITSITMHGTYTERKNLKEYNEKITELIGERMPKADESQALTLFHYMTATMDFDKAIGIMMEDLESKGILDDTLIVIFGDHNAYYNSLSNYVKDIDGYETEHNYTDLYKVPLMIYDSNLLAKIPQEKRVIKKFACTSDIVPTVLDLLGIKYYENMFYGHSLFDTKRQSALYSRAYGIFVGSGLVGRSVKNIVYWNKAVTMGEAQAFQAEATKLVEKMKYCDYIFISNWFKNAKRVEKFRQKMQDLNDVTL